MKEKIKKFLRDMELCNGFYDFIIEPDESRLLVNYIKQLKQENKQLKEQLLVAQTNEETFRLEMEDITKILGLDEDTIFDDVKAYVRSLKDNWNRLRKQEINRFNKTQDVQFLDVLQDMQELEKGDK